MATFNQKFRSPQEYANDPTMRALGAIGNGRLSDWYSLSPENDNLDEFLSKLTGEDASSLSPQIRAEARRMGMDARLASHILTVRNATRTAMEQANAQYAPHPELPDNTTMGTPGGSSYRSPRPPMRLDPATGSLMDQGSYQVQYGDFRSPGAGSKSTGFTGAPRAPSPIPAFRQGFNNRSTGVSAGQRAYHTFMGGR